MRNKIEATTIIYGIGKRARRLLELLSENDRVVLVDSNPIMKGTLYDNRKVYVYQEAQELFTTAKRVCITVGDTTSYLEIKMELGKFNIPLISYNDYLVECIRNKFVRVAIAHKRLSSHPRIAIASAQGVSFGGVETWVRDLTINLNMRGYDVDIVTMQPETITHESVEPYIHMICDSNEETFVGQVKEIVSYYLTQLPDLVVTTQPDLFLQCAKAINEIPTIATIHGCNPEIINTYSELYFSNLRYVGCAEEIATELKRIGVPAYKTYSMKIPFSCEQNIFRSYTTDEECPVKIGWAGRLHSMEQSDQKRLDNLLKYAKELKERHINYVMEIAGDGLAKEKFEYYVNELGLNNRIHMCGYLNQNEIQDFWRRQDICVLSSDLEGRSISVLEAMGNGAVPVVTAVSGVREDIIDGHNGFIVEIGDYEALVERTIYLEQHRELLPLMGVRAHDMIYPKSKQDVHVNFWVKLIEECVKERI